MFVLKIFGIMDLIVISDKNGVHIIQLIDQIHALFIAQKEAGGAKSICRQGGICDNRYTVQIIFAGITGSRI